MWAPEIKDATRRAIVNELYYALSKIEAPDELITIVCKWSDTMNDAATLAHLRSFDRNGAMSVR
jgi:hypothetical protein